MATASISTRSIQGESLPASIDRLINTVLAREGVHDKDGGSFKVTQDTGSNMQVKVGSGTAGDIAVVESDEPQGGTYVCEHQNATQTLVVSAADPADDRIDIVVLRVYDDTFDSSGREEADLEIIEGTPAGSPTAPAVPDGAIKLAEIEVGAGVTAITDADITDTREELKCRGELVETLYFTSSGTFKKADYPWLRKVRVIAVGGGGGSGGTVTTSGGESAAGAGGGGGGTGIATVAVSDLSASEIVTVGSGGTRGTPGGAGVGGQSSFGDHARGNGGGGGGTSPAQAAPFATATGGDGGGGTGDIVIRGEDGGAPFAVTAVNPRGGYGGGSYLSGSLRPNASNNQSGVNALGWGQGGAGAHAGPNQSAQFGGHGRQGIVIVELYA